MRHEDLFYVLALLKVEGVGDIIAKKLLSRYEDPATIFKTKGSQLKLIDGFGSVLLRNLKDKSVFEKAEAEISFIQKNNINVSFYQDQDYPERLKHCVDSPVLLFTSGNIQLQQRKVISIVGTRNITPQGMEVCRQFIADLAPLDPVIISGFAYGVDIVAHQSAMEHQLQTIGVLAHGLNQIYPKPHKKYVARMERNGGFMTEFWSSSSLDKENFVRRNRIVAGISEATVVIESAIKGGSLITANLANDYNREVFAVPGRSSDVYSQGCNNLIKTQRAQLLTNAADLIYHLNWDVKTPSNKPIQKQLFVALDENEEKIYAYLQTNGKELMDIIALACALPIHKISGILVTMELKGIIRPLPGKYFEAI